MPFAAILTAARRLVAGIALALPLACLQVGTALPSEASRSELEIAGMVLAIAGTAHECPVGALGCPCTSGGGCDPGLVCVSGYCEVGGGEQDVYEFEEDLAAPEPAPELMIESKRSITRGPGRAKAKAKLGGRPGRGFDEGIAKDMPAAAAPAEAIADPIGGTAVPKPSPDDDSRPEATQDASRLVVYTAGLDVAVYELDAAIELAERLPERYGGWIESRYDYQITLRIPAERLFEALELLSGLGLVLGKSLRADDVTAEFTDLESRILVLEQLVEQLELLLKQAKTVEEALKIRIELDRVRVELEAARTRMRALSELIDFSTLTLRLSQRGDADPLPTGNDPFPWVDDLGVETTEYR